VIDQMTVVSEVNSLYIIFQAVSLLMHSNRYMIVVKHIENRCVET